MEEESESSLTWDSRQYFIDLVAKRLWMVIPAVAIGLILGLCVGAFAIFLFKVPYLGKRRRKDKRCVFFIVKQRNGNVNIDDLPQSDLQCVTHL